MRPGRFRIDRAAAGAPSRRIRRRAGAGGRVRVCAAEPARARIGADAAHSHVGAGRGGPPHREPRGKTSQAQRSEATTEAIEAGETGTAEIARAQDRSDFSRALPFAAETRARNPKAISEAGKV